MENKRWIEILIEKKKLDADPEITIIDDDLPAYLVEGVNIETSADEILLVYDCSSLSETETFCYRKMTELAAKHNDPYAVVVFKNWEHERKMYRSYYKTLGVASERKEFSTWFDKKLSVYVDGYSKVTLETDDRGVNYLEYPVKNNNENAALYGRVYNISFYELKKLFNVTGAHLFIKNVRYGLQRNSTGETLRTRFREYLGCALYKKALELNFSPKVIEELKEQLDIDAGAFLYLEQLQQEGIEPEIDGGFLLPENFWFYHNGISLFSYDEILQTPANQIILAPNKVSVINGAQTLTNFFLEVEKLEWSIEPLLKDEKISARSVIDSIIKTIFVKTIIICGNDKLVRPITHGLNTQIPILEETLLADSDLCDSINGRLESSSDCSGRIKILKDGERWGGECGLGVLDFVKNWLTVYGEPGKSKNFGKKHLKEKLSEIDTILKTDTSAIKKMDILFQIYQWWDGAREQRIVAHSESKEALVIGKYGRNYFGSYVLHMLRKAENDPYLDEAFFTIMYERFLKDLNACSVVTGIPIVLGTFKQDELSKELFNAQTAIRAEEQAEDIVVPDDIEENLRVLLNQKGQSAYAFSKTIADYLLEHDVSIDYFRVVSRTDGKCKEAFPFPNSTFTEIVEQFAEYHLVESGAGRRKAFEDSNLAKAVERVFPVFVVDKDDRDSRHTVNRINFIQKFSFGKYVEDARRVYEQTMNAFELGEEGQFPRSSDKQHFHIRPKAVNAEDTFQFTNGDMITKRTFWANKDTVEALINEALGASEEK